MEPKRGTYATNPLDDDVVAHADQSWGTPQPNSEKHHLPQPPARDTAPPTPVTSPKNLESEAPTQRIDEKITTSYPSIFVPSPPRGPAYQAPRIAVEDIYQ